MKLRDLIRSYRDSHDLSQRQFAIQCNLSNGYISILEKGINPNTGKPVTPTIPQLKKLADGMAISLNELLEQVDDMPIDLSAFDSFSSTLHISKQAPIELSEDEIELVRKYRCLDERGKSAVRNILMHEYESLPGENSYSTAKEA